MKRVYKSTVLSESVIEAARSVEEALYWLVITEGWCGDAAQNIPVIAKIAENAPNIELRLILRDEHPEVMDAYLTNQARSIPKLICVRKNDLEEVGLWGPRPEPFQRAVMEYKENPTMPYAAFQEELHRKYYNDGGNTLQEEFVALIRQWNEKS